VVTDRGRTLGCSVSEYVLTGRLATVVGDRGFWGATETGDTRDAFVSHTLF
jgi:hypothetical protein